MSCYPGSSATAQRIRLTLKGLKLLGFYPLIINKRSFNSKGYKTVNRSDGIPFLFTSYKPYRPASFFLRNINKFTGVAGEAFLLFTKRKKLHTAILYTSSFSELVYYRLISKLLGFKIIIQYVELRSSIPERNNFGNRLNDKLFDQYFYLFCDGVIAISDFLADHVTAKSRNLPTIKLPAICDFNQFSNVQPHFSSPYLMYCGNIIYIEVIEFIIDIFVELKARNKYEGNLILVISGTDENNWKLLKTKITRLDCGNCIIIKTNIPYSDLLSLYKGADILMIPMRDTLQDNARFPHKIGEYSASQRPILSSNSGELKIYFKDGISAILANDYSLTSYVKKLVEILPEKANLDDIGRRGYETGIENFDYRSQALKLSKFILNL